MKLLTIIFWAHRLRHGNSIALEEALNELLELKRRAMRGAIACDIVLMFTQSAHGNCDESASRCTDQAPLCTRD